MMNAEAQGNAPRAWTSVSMKSLLREQQQAPYAAEKKKSRQRNVLLCCRICSAIVAVLTVVLIILIFTLFKQKDPKIHVDSMTLKWLSVNIGNIFIDPNLSVDVDLATNVTIKNPNYSGFDYGSTTAYIYYQGELIGESPVAPGKVKSRQSAQMMTATRVHITGSILNGQLTKDVTAGVIPIVSTVQIEGTAKVFGIFGIKNVRTSAHCDVIVYLQNQTESFHCDYKVKL